MMWRNGFARLESPDPTCHSMPTGMEGLARTGGTTWSKTHDGCQPNPVEHVEQPRIAYPSIASIADNLDSVPSPLLPIIPQSRFRAACATTATTPSGKFHERVPHSPGPCRETPIAAIAFNASNQTPLISKHLQKSINGVEQPAPSSRTHLSHLSPIIPGVLAVQTVPRNNRNNPSILRSTGPICRPKSAFLSYRLVTHHLWPLPEFQLNKPFSKSE